MLPQAFFDRYQALRSQFDSSTPTIKSDLKDLAESLSTLGTQVASMAKLQDQEFRNYASLFKSGNLTLKELQETAKRFLAIQALYTDIALLHCEAERKYNSLPHSL